MLPQEIIRKKRDGASLSPQDIGEFFDGFSRGQVTEYQVAAMLMAMLLKGMRPEETTALTTLMRDSGKTLQWGADRHRVIDKHSSGGIGDKTSLVLLPLCVLEGCLVPMMSGRGLGHTGGTLDKLESIPGTRVRIPMEEAQRLVKSLGGVFMAQTSEIAVLDGKLYALRDVTATVESIPLITASILSKKLAEGISALVMDVKFGSGAFMASQAAARDLAHSLAQVGTSCGLRMRCLLTDMNSPLGTHAGNGLEVVEVVEILKNKGPASTRELSLRLAAECVHLAFPDRSVDSIKTSMEANLANGRAFELFCKIIHAQGGDTSYLDHPEKLVTAKLHAPVNAPRSGVVARINTRELGVAINMLGGGRSRVQDNINPAVGLTGLRRVGDPIQKGEPLAIVHADQAPALESAILRLADAYMISDNAKAEPLIADII